MRALLPLCALALALTLAACGGSSHPGTSGPSAEVQKAAAQAAALRHSAEAKAPKGSSPTLRAIYATFTAPKVSAAEKRPHAAVIAGEAACRGKLPAQVKEEFYAKALHRLQPEQTKMIDQIDTYEHHSATDQSFVSGQLAADVYEATLPPYLGQYGYEGCVYALAQGLEHRIAPKG